MSLHIRHHKVLPTLCSTKFCQLLAVGLIHITQSFQSDRTGTISPHSWAGQMAEKVPDIPDRSSQLVQPWDNIALFCRMHGAICNFIIQQQQGSISESAPLHLTPYLGGAKDLQRLPDTSHTATDVKRLQKTTSHFR